MLFGVKGFVSSFSLFPVVWLALALVDVRWSTMQQNAINIVAQSRTDDVQECLEGALKAKLRFEVRVCRRRSGWFDLCDESRSELHTVTYDEVTESYRVVSDRLDDEQEPIALEISSRPEAIRLATSLEGLPLKFLLHEEPDLLDHKEAYLQVRTVFICRGNSSRPFTHISRVLTLGLLNNVEDRSAWEDFPLPGQARPTE